MNSDFSVIMVHHSYLACFDCKWQDNVPYDEHDKRIFDINIFASMGDIRFYGSVLSLAGLGYYQDNPVRCVSAAHHLLGNHETMG